MSIGKLFVRMKGKSSRAVTVGTNALNTDNAASGRDRVYVSASVSAGETVTVELVSQSGSSTAWFACPQLESGNIANRVNLLVNGDFSRTQARGSQTFAESWGASKGIPTNAQNGVISASAAGMPTALSGNTMGLFGYRNTASNSHIQTVEMSGAKNDVYESGGWMNSTSVASGGTHFKPCLVWRFMKMNGSWQDWQSFVGVSF